MDFQKAARVDGSKQAVAAGSPDPLPKTQLGPFLWDSITDSLTQQWSGSSSLCEL